MCLYPSSLTGTHGLVTSQDTAPHSTADPHDEGATPAQTTTAANELAPVAGAPRKTGSTRTRAT